MIMKTKEVKTKACMNCAKLRDDLTVMESNRDVWVDIAVGRGLYVLDLEQGRDILLHALVYRAEELSDVEQELFYVKDDLLTCVARLKDGYTYTNKLRKENNDLIERIYTLNRSGWQKFCDWFKSWAVTQ